LQTPDACRSNGIIRPTDLLRIDPHQLFDKHVALAAEGFEQHIPPIIEERAKRRMQALGRRGRADWNRTIAEVENHVAYLQLDRAQRMKDLSPLRPRAHKWGKLRFASPPTPPTGEPDCTYRTWAQCRASQPGVGLYCYMNALAGYVFDTRDPANPRVIGPKPVRKPQTRH
jgi:hypothetical protein